MNQTILGITISIGVVLIALAVYFFFFSTGQSGSMASLETIQGIIRGVA